MQRLFGSAFVAWWVLLLGGGAHAADSGSCPNIVILLADDLGYGELGCQGNDQIPTPNIDRIAANGVRFTSGYVTASYCSASRAGLMTGRNQARFGYDDNPTGARNEIPGAGLPLDEKTLAAVLRDGRGYSTSLIGKWHLGGTAPFNPMRRGFDEFFGFTHEGHFFVPPPYNGVTTMLRRKTLPGGSQGRWVSADRRLVVGTHMGRNEPDYDANNPIVRQSQPIAEPDYLTDAFTREAVDFIGRNKDRPFFLYVAYNAVHSPLQGADRYMKRFASIDDIHRRIFAAMLANLDDSVGAIMGKLEAEELTENTLVFFLSDNGGPTRELTSSNLPLRGGKGQLYEGGIRVPFMCQWPGRVAKGETYANAVSSLDIFATSITAANCRGVSAETDGVDLIPYLQRTTDGRPHDDLYWRMNRRAALRSGDWKVVGTRGQPDGWQLFNLSQDLAEKNDLANADPSTLNRLVEQWQSWDRKMKPPVVW